MYCQVLKQTNNNPNLESCERGWELFCMMLDIFQPTKDFENYLKSYFASNWQYKGKVSKQALYCYKRLLYLSKNEIKVYRPPSTSELQRSIKAPFVNLSFRSTLEEIMEQQKTSYPDLEVPRVLQYLVESIEQSNGFTTQGIFRIQASFEDVFELRDHLEEENFNISIKDPHVPASLLKTWLRDIYDPIITASLYRQFIDNRSNISVVKELIENLPPYNRAVLKYLIQFFQKVARESKINLMTEKNLAIVISPNLCRCPEDESPQKIIEATKLEIELVDTIFVKY